MLFVLSFLAVLAFMATRSVATAEAASDGVAVQLAVTVQATEENILANQVFLVWQQLNQARSNPRQTMSRLGISEDSARAALGQDAWILDQALPPLALNNQLVASAAGHGRDMLDHLYYSEVSPSGYTLAQRVAATGYEAAFEGESLSAMVFQNLVSMEMAVGAMVDTMLRDELTVGSGVRRKIFSSDFSEVGVGFLAESVALLDGKPYVYLLVVDCAQPVVPRYFVVGTIGGAVERVMVKNRYTGFWTSAVIFPGKAYQFQLSVEGEDIVVQDSGNNVLFQGSTQGVLPGRNYYLELGAGL